MGAELFHAYGRTDMTKLIVAFRNFCERAKKKKSFLTVKNKFVPGRKWLLSREIRPKSAYPDM